MTTRRIRDLRRRFGVDVVPTRSGHLRLIEPGTGRVLAVTPSTPSDRRGDLNLATNIHRSRTTT